MKWIIAAVGQRQPDWVVSAFNDYAGRFPPDQPLVLKEVKAEPRTTGKTVAAMKALEAERIRTAVEKEAGRSGAVLVALDERGKTLTTQEFAALTDQLRQQSSDVAFLIGGPDGLDDALKASSHHQIRLSSMTLPHGLARVLLAEQLYRAWSLLNNHPYHRA
jgi:23S rRNA (pseudouridine1915-N3)-methyltransferase